MSAVLAISVVLATAAAFGQGGLRVNHSIVRTTPTHVEVAGTVQNETRAEAVDVSVTVEAIGANGKSVARGISYAAARLPGGATVNFVMKVPAVAGVTSYRANVTARFVQSIEGP